MQLHEQPIVIELQRKLKELLFDFAILGGYPRDRANNRKPKDLDICIFNYHPNDIAEETFTRNLYNWLIDQYIPIETFDNYDGEDENIYMVWKLPNVDLIFYQMQFKTIGQVIHTFDMNMNKYTLTDDKCTYHGQHEGIALIDNPNRSNPDRLNHMRDVAKEIGWDTTQIG